MAIDLDGKIFNSKKGDNKMTEPTRQQIKEAFNKTIERWERIVEDVGYQEDSGCSLCGLFPGYSGSCNQYVCPVAIYAKSFGCNGTPFHTFNNDKTPFNALAELNFLRKVYIWWNEGEAKDSMGEPLYGYKKKEEWVDVTEDVEFKISKLEEYYSLHLRDKKYHFGFIVNGEVGICSGDKDRYQIKTEPAHKRFRILKKV